MRLPPAFILSFPVLAALALPALGADASSTQLEGRFHDKVHPFLQTYCFGCHGGGDKTEADLDLTSYSSMEAVLKDGYRWGLVMDRLEAEEMPPDKAKLHPSADVRREAVGWFQALRDYETQHNAGDPGRVLARRLSNVEYDYTIRDLTGVDLRPTKEFPVDPSNMAGFDNSGESLTMSPTLLNKYLQAARDVASHMYLKEQGFAFASRPMLVETDRDQFCVQQIIDYYHAQDIDYADYFQAAWRFRNRAALGEPALTLADCAKENHVSPKYLATIWSTLETPAEVGPAVKLQTLWKALPAPQGKQADAARVGCEEMRDYVVTFRKKTEMRFLNINAGTPGTEWLPFLVWKNIQYATHRRDWDRAQLQVKDEPPPPKPTGIIRIEGGNQFGPGRTPPVVNAPGDPDLVVPAGERARYEAAFTQFCSVFPDMFYKEQRGRDYFRTGRDEGRYLSAGYHNVMGYFRDDQAFTELLLDEKQQAKLDEMWRELDFIAAANIRSFVQFGVSGTRGARESFRDNEPSVPLNVHLNDEELSSTPILRKLEADYLARVTNGDDVAINAIKDYFDSTDKGIHWVRDTRLAAQPSHVQALLDFAAKAYRRPLTKEDRDDILDFYHTVLDRDHDHEGAIRESIVMVLMAPEFTYRVDLGEAAAGVHPLSDYDLASRLSYFLWSSMPDEELLAHAAKGDLHEPGVIKAQARRLLQDPRARALAVEFGGNWLDFRRFEGIGTVDLERFPVFTPELKEAMYEEPIRLLQDVFQANRPILDLIYGHDTFVNPALAKHYGIPVTATRADEWVHVTDADHYDRGGLLPMAVFLTKNAPGQRTSPVKRGNWVVRNILGERIPPPPPAVPELPHDEAKLDLPLRDVLARHRADPSCASCHARFDALGLVFEGFGPVGDRRDKDLAGRPVDDHATFPGGSEGAGLGGLERYIHDKRENDFVDNFSGKLLAYALGRSLLVSDDATIHEMHQKLAADGYRFDNLVDSIVTSRQFLTKRGRDDLAVR
ncbi:MAG TPA: DUF1592 domain-containing protein [Opitutaceae bacterium]|nr:DUF1592 domain-containing protein [Opitutaceae bacterium]